MAAATVTLILDLGEEKVLLVAVLLRFAGAGRREFEDLVWLFCKRPCVSIECIKNGGAAWCFRFFTHEFFFISIFFQNLLFMLFFPKLDIEQYDFKSNFGFFRTSKK